MSVELVEPGNWGCIHDSICAGAIKGGVCRLGCAKRVTWLSSAFKYSTKPRQLLAYVLKS
jgi:hypothetical protein